MAQDAGVRVASAGSSTLRDFDLYVKLIGKKAGHLRKELRSVPQGLPESVA